MGMPCVALGVGVVGAGRCVWGGAFVDAGPSSRGCGLCDDDAGSPVAGELGRSSMSGSLCPGSRCCVKVSYWMSHHSRAQRSSGAGAGGGSSSLSSSRSCCGDDVGPLTL